LSVDRAGLLAIDAGNTRTKWALFNIIGEVLSQGVCANADLALAEVLPKNTVCKQAIISNVAGAEIAKVLVKKCLALDLAVIWLKAPSLDCGVKNNYDSPSQLGADRWASLIAAWSIYQTSCVVVNLGTAVTIDALVSNHNHAEFLGGLIMPGLTMLQQILVNGTHDIESGIASTSCNDLSEINSFPTNTTDAVYTGACLAIVGAIAEMVARLQIHCEQVIVILSGGDAHSLMPLLGLKFNTDSLKRVFVNDNLVLQGLYCLERESA